MGKGKYWLSKFIESLISTAPIALVILIFFLVARFALPEGTFAEAYVLTNNDLIGFGISVAMIVVGMTLFNVGTEESMSEIGELIGGSLKKKKNFFFVVVMTFILGVLVTIAEPDLSVLSGQIGIDKQIIVWTIGIGVGLFLVIGVCRVFFKKSLNIMFLAFYGLVFVLGYIIDPRFLPICFDSGGVTTGPVTVPFLLGFGLGLATTHGGKSAEDSFGMTALCSVGPIIAVTVIAAIMKASGKSLPLEYADPLKSLTNDVFLRLKDSLLTVMGQVGLSVGPIFLFFIVYDLLFIKLPFKTVLRVFIGLVVTYIGLTLFSSAVETGFMPIASKVGQGLGSKSEFFPLAIGLGTAFGLFGVLAEPAVHVLVGQIESVSEGVIRKKTVLLILAISIGAAVALHIVRSKFQFSIMYYLVPGYIIAFALSFLVPKIYTAMAFDSGGVASGPMTSTFVLPFCVGFAYSSGADVYSYGFGLVAMVAMMPLIVLQWLGFAAVNRKRRALAKARKRLVEENDDQIVHFDMEGSYGK